MPMTSRWTRQCGLAVLAGCCIQGSALLSCYDVRTVRRRGQAGGSASRAKEPDSVDDDDERVDLDSVTDAEALLACRAYLQRKNRLGAWKDHKRRKDSLRQMSTLDNVNAAATGFFWEDPEELIYLHHDNTTDDLVDNEEENDEGRVVFESALDGTGTMIMGSTPPALERGIEFTSFPAMPSEERVRRSNAAKKTWSDPKWKAMWYEKRWGRHPRKNPLAAKQKKLDDRIRSLPSNLYNSPELAALTQEEIVEAVQTYVVGNRKRSKAHGKEARQRAKTERANENKVPEKGQEPKIDLMFGSNNAMKEAQRKRSERAAKAYQTRLANQNKKEATTKAKTTGTREPVAKDAMPTAKTPRDALVRVETQLDSNELPSIADIELILKPPKLGRRKDLLRRILSEQFDLRGKCVPADPSNEGSEMLFVTQCSIDQLGAFVVQTVREKQENAVRVQDKAH